MTPLRTERKQFSSRQGRIGSFFRPYLVEHAKETEPDNPVLARPMKLSILMPVFNEERTIAQAVCEVLSQPYPCDVELVVIDDGSTDATPRILDALSYPSAKVVRHTRNAGKGAALLSGAAVADGTHLVPFDADLEYNPADLVQMIYPVLEQRSDVVYGVRLFGTNTRYLSYRQAVGNRALTFAANVMFDACLSDLHTCLKLLPVEVFRQLKLSEEGFGLDTEITAKLLAVGLRPFEVPVSYHSRSVHHGKKITWRDGLKCLQILASVRTNREQGMAVAAAAAERVSPSPETYVAASVDQISSLIAPIVEPSDGRPEPIGAERERREAIDRYRRARAQRRDLVERLDHPGVI